MSPNAINPKDLSDDTLTGHIIPQESAQKIRKVVEIYMVSSQVTRLIRATCRLIAFIHQGIEISIIDTDLLKGPPRFLFGETVTNFSADTYQSLIVRYRALDKLFKS